VSGRRERGFWLKTVLAAAGAALLLAAQAAAAAQSSPPAVKTTSVTASAPQSAPELSTPGSGTLVISNPQALACEDAAKIGDFNGAGADECTAALSGPLLTQSDRAAIFTDRGSVHLQHKQYAAAKADFDSALLLDADTADAYVDRGAALLGMKDYAAAIADIDRGLALKPDQPEKAYFNRGIADEHLNDLKAAYQDYLKASQLAPAWDAPKRVLAVLQP
jgi:tetratricopeptide (TPR) repeat protein